jgi:hypothetical protein
LANLGFERPLARREHGEPLLMHLAASLCFARVQTQRRNGDDFRYPDHANFTRASHSVAEFSHLQIYDRHEFLIAGKWEGSPS